eukprot:COSAG01_NODE_1862_length_9038_cov_3.750755_7_plen_47_part_00
MDVCTAQGVVRMKCVRDFKRLNAARKKALQAQDRAFGTDDRIRHRC